MINHREQTLESLRRQPEVSVLIVGGGINGLGLLRELALQQIDALLVEKSDFAAGASAASTRIIHGGLRYLENGEFRLVKESLRERNRLLENAPHYVRPLPTTIPIFDWIGGVFHAAKTFLGWRSKPGSRGALIVKTGLTLYDLFARTGQQRALPTHVFTSRRKALSERPALNPAIVCTATYYDAQISAPERLCLELALDAESAFPQAKALNYAAVCDADGGAVSLRDELTGETLTIRPTIVVNATGAWIDFTNRALHQETKFIGGTKGSHLVLDHPELWQATRGQMLYFGAPEGRICIFYPYYDRVIAGSTDIPVDDPETAVCDEDETAYILDSIRRVFPDIQVDRSHIVFRFSGVRPLPREDAATPGQVSRDHSCRVIQNGLPIYSLIGGKWTTFRAFGEQVADELLRALDKPRRASSENLPIGGGQDYPKTDGERQRWLSALGAKTGLTLERLETLFERYGTRAEAAAAYIAAGDDTPLRCHPGYSRREVEFLAAEERVAHLDDLILRRTLIGLLGQTTPDLLAEIAAIAAPVVGWDSPQAEVERTAAILASKHGVRLKLA